jgi:hypothetical protein
MTRRWPKIWLHCDLVLAIYLIRLVSLQVRRLTKAVLSKEGSKMRLPWPAVSYGSKGLPPDYYILALRSDAYTKSVHRVGRSGWARRGDLCNGSLGQWPLVPETESGSGCRVA